MKKPLKGVKQGKRFGNFGKKLEKELWRCSLFSILAIKKLVTRLNTDLSTPCIAIKFYVEACISTKKEFFHRKKPAIELKLEFLELYSNWVLGS